MRLLQRNGAGQLSLTEDFLGERIPKYAILSHTWGADTEEVTFGDLMRGAGKDKPGYKKIYFCEEQAKRDGLLYFWVDTCCIDKRNSTELAEAINSMFRWYRNAVKCYVYLSDVSRNDHEPADPALQSWQIAFQKSRWFTRGWTLQELIAPPSVEFFCSNGKLLGDKKSLEQQLHGITGIVISALRGTPLSMFSIEERMSWIERRQTNREEDMAYSLLGIFDIYLPLIYGEGAGNAFRRLREEVDKRRGKHQPEEQSLIPAKRPKSLQNQSSSVLSCGISDFSNPKPLSNSQPSVQSVLDHSSTENEPVRSIDATTKQSLIEQLYFAKIDERLTSLTAAQGTTCRWFLTKPEYASWHDATQHSDHGGFLWIKGNPGTGKSTLMKLLFEEAKLNAKRNHLQITLSFFFLARGTTEEKSTMGLYRSLLHQLFEKAVELRDSLEWMTTDGARFIQRDGWHEEALKSTLKHATQNLGNRSLTIFVDALDECDKTQIGGMVSFFEELCTCAREANVRLQICFSSRHYPTVDIQKGIEITLEHEIGHMEDIKQYIKSELRLGKLKQAESLRAEILEKSSNIFLWVVLVLDILNSEYAESSISARKMRERLREMPPKLSDLFEMILTRDGENLERLQVCLKWVLFATRPLKPQELYFAIQIGLDKECSTYWDQEDVELDQIKTFVRRSSKGLAEVTQNNAAEVQFIHESVRDFLLGKYESHWSGASGNFVGHSHEILRDCCLAQLKAATTQNGVLPSIPLRPLKARRLRKTIDLRFPFLKYSILNVLCHANYAQHNGLEQGDFLASFDLERWILLNNIIEIHDIRRYPESARMIYILADMNLTDLIRIHPQRESCFDVGSERYGLPIFAALATRSHEAVRTFLEVQAEIYPQAPLLHHMCKQHFENRNKRTNFGRSLTFSSQKSVFYQLVEQGDDVLVAFFCLSGDVDVETKDTSGYTPLIWAAKHGNEVLVKLLLENGAQLETRDWYGRTALVYAALDGHETVVKLLLENGAQLETRDKYDRTPLIHAACNGHEKVLKLLLENGAQLETGDWYGRTALIYAACNGHEKVLKLLLENGAQLETRDKYGWTPLIHAACNGHETIVRLLLENDAQIEGKDKENMTSLLSAVRNGHEGVVKVLLENHAQVKTTDVDGHTPLWWTIYWGRGNNGKAAAKAWC